MRPHLGHTVSACWLSRTRTVPHSAQRSSRVSLSFFMGVIIGRRGGARWGLSTPQTPLASPLVLRFYIKTRLLTTTTDPQGRRPRRGNSQARHPLSWPRSGGSPLALSGRSRKPHPRARDARGQGGGARPRRGPGGIGPRIAARRFAGPTIFMALVREWPPMRLPVPLLVVLVLGIAGCVTPTATPPSGGTTAASLNGWSIDCATGAASHAKNASWAQTCEARGSTTPGQKQETWIAINPKDPNNVVVGAKDLNPESSAQCVWNGLAVTHDGGKTWKDVVIGGKYADRDPTSPYYGYACNTDPDFQFTSDGALHYGVEMYGFGSKDANGLLGGTPAAGLADGFKILLATSHDGGDTWPDVITYQPDILVTTDYSRMTIDPVSQAIIEAIGSDGGGRCHVLVSKDGGKTAQPVVEVQTPDGAPCNSGAGTAIAVSPKGVVTLIGGQVGSQGDPVGATGGGGTDAQPIVVRSTDDGMTWLDENPGFKFKPIAPFKESKYRVGSVVELAYDLTSGPNKGTLYASYAAADRDEADIFVRSSKDDGKTW